MRNIIRALPFARQAAIVSVALSLAAAHQATAQTSQRGQPTTAFATADFAKLRWIEGAWQGSAPGEPSVYERYHFVNDSTIEITYFGDSSLTRETGTGRVYMTVGRIYHTFGSGRWGATHVDAGSVYFIPQVNAHNSFAWSSQSPDAWTSTMRMAMSGREQVTVYQMRRIASR